MSNVLAHQSTSKPLVGALRQLMRARNHQELAKRLFWRRLAIGSLVFLVCVVLACLIYYLRDHGRDASAQEEFAGALAQAFEKKPLTVEAIGKVNLAPSEVSLAPHQMVSLQQDVSNSLAVSPPNSPQKAHPSIPNDKKKSEASSKDQTVYDFVVFKTIPFLNGKIETAWNYVNSNQETPTSQNCKYRKAIEVGHDEYVLLAVDGYPKVNPKTVEFDVYDALKNCVWFDK